jgi:hypothetical protein
VDPTSLEGLPVGLSGSDYHWVDLDGEGISGILTEQGGAWFFKRNQSPLNVIGEDQAEAQFGPIEIIPSRPATSLGGNNNVQFLDLDGNGRLDVVQFDRAISGFYERTSDSGWNPFLPFRSLPNVDW